MHLGAARNLSAVQEDLHDLAGLVSAVWALQPAESAAVLRADRRPLSACFKGTVAERLKRAQEIENCLLIGIRQLPEIVDHGIRLRRRKLIHNLTALIVSMCEYRL